MAEKFERNYDMNKIRKIIRYGKYIKKCPTPTWISREKLIQSSIKYTREVKNVKIPFEKSNKTEFENRCVRILGIPM